LPWLGTLPGIGYLLDAEWVRTCQTLPRGAFRGRVTVNSLITILSLSSALVKSAQDQDA
jgi:hypothetical protein